MASAGTGWVPSAPFGAGERVAAFVVDDIEVLLALHDVGHRHPSALRVTNPKTVRSGRLMVRGAILGRGCRRPLHCWIGRLMPRRRGQPVPCARLVRVSRLAPPAVGLSCHPDRSLVRVAGCRSLM